MSEELPELQMPSVDGMMALVEKLADEAHSNGFDHGASHGYNFDRKSELAMEAAIRAYAERLATRDWRDVQRDGLPPCDAETVYIGINSAGYSCCFNECVGGTCFMDTDGYGNALMSELRWWRVLDRPVAALSKDHQGGQQ